MSKSDYRPLYLAALLICCSLLSHSNSVDDQTVLSMASMLCRSLGILLLGIAGYISFQTLTHYKHYR